MKNKYNKKVFHQKLKKYRRKAGYKSAKEFAEELSKDGGDIVPENTYKSYESGLREPNFTMLLRIVNKLGIHVDDLFRIDNLPINTEKQVINGLEEILPEGQFIIGKPKLCILYRPYDGECISSITGKHLCEKNKLTDKIQEENTFVTINDSKRGYIQISISEYKKLEEEAKESRKMIFKEYLNKKWINRDGSDIDDDDLRFLKIMARSIHYPWIGFERSNQYINDNALDSRMEILFFYYLYHIDLLNDNKINLYRLLDGLDVYGYPPDSPKNYSEKKLAEGMKYNIKRDINWINQLIADKCQVKYHRLCKKANELNLKVSYILKYIYIETLAYDNIGCWNIGTNISIYYTEIGMDNLIDDFIEVENALNDGSSSIYTDIERDKYLYRPLDEDIF